MVPDIINFTDIIQFLKDTWAPIVESLHSNKGGIIGEFLSHVLRDVKELPTHEVCVWLYA